VARDPRRGGNAAAYEVGYGKPPERTRFQKGRSGNPAGRPKGAQNLDTLLDKALRETVVVKDGTGRRRSITKGEAIATQLVNKAAAGADPRAMRLLFDLLAKRQARESRASGAGPRAGPSAGPGEGPPARPDPPTNWAAMTTAELRVAAEFMRILDRLSEAPPADCPMPPAGPGGDGPDSDAAPPRWYTPEDGEGTG
jgi:hypothetical protein